MAKIIEIGKKLRRRAATMLKHGCDKEICDLMNEAADELCRYGRANALLSARLANKGIEKNSPGISAIVGRCKRNDMSLYSTISGGLRALLIGKEAPRGWKWIANITKGATYQEICAIVKSNGLKLSLAAEQKAEDFSVFVIDSIPSGGFFVPEQGSAKESAEAASSYIKCTVDLWRVNNGFRLTKPDSKINGEFLGRFDQNATLEDIQEAIE